MDEHAMDAPGIEEQNLVERYVTGRLLPEEAARFEEYFLEHPECAAEVRMAQRLHRGLEAVAAEEVVGTSLALGLWSRRLRGPGAMLASLVVAVLVVLGATVPLRLQQERIGELEEHLEAARRPQVNTPIFELSGFRSSQPSPHLVSLSSDPEWIVLVLELSAPQRPSYRAELRDAEDRLVWEAADLLPDPLGRLVMTLPSTLLSEGEFEIRVAGAGDTEPAPASRFALRVTVDF